MMGETWGDQSYIIPAFEVVAIETTLPSFNDHIASGIGGSFLDEPLSRMASLVLEGGGEKPGLFRELFAACISPPTGINRLLYGVNSAGNGHQEMWASG